MLSNVGEIKHKAFVHAFKNTPLDEVEYAKIVADTINIPLEIVEIDKKDITDSIDNIIYYFESVYCGMPDSAYRIYNAQKKEGFKISIDGHGADEMLGGYGWYLDELQKDVPILNIFKHLEILQHRKEMTLDKKARSKRSLLKFGYERLPKNLQKKIKNVIKGKVVTELYDYEKDELPDGWTYLKQRLYEDFSYTILPRILKNFDAVSMANSIEVRMPFLDYRLVEFVFSLNNDDLIQKKWTKYILRKAMEGILDERVVWRKDKKGFNSPVADMLSKELKEWTIDAISHADEELFDKKELQKDFETKILAYRSWDESLKFWTKINTIKLMNIYKKKKEQKNA
jgi:asparagine synthase (glutamine-hydrolysing)